MLLAPCRHTILEAALTWQTIRHSGCDRCCCMQGNCRGAPPSAASLGLSGAPLLPLLSYQCLLIADVQLLWVDSQLWLDGIYVRYRRTGRVTSSEGHCNGFIFNQGSLWMTAVTLQGDGDSSSDCTVCGLVNSGDVYVEGALLVCLNVWCSSCTLITAAQHLLPPHRAFAILLRPAARALPCLVWPAPLLCAGLAHILGVCHAGCTFAHCDGVDVSATFHSEHRLSWHAPLLTTTCTGCSRCTTVLHLSNWMRARLKTTRSCNTFCLTGFVVR
jgi:hypothetical protein